MTTLSWLALAAGVLLCPVIAPAQARTVFLIERGRLAARPATRRRSSAVSVSPGAPAVLSCSAVVLVVLVVLVQFGAVLAATTAIASATLARMLSVARQSRTTRREAAELLAALRMLGAELDAGARADAAFAAAAEVCPQHRADFASAARSCSAGEQPVLHAAPLAGLSHAWRVADSSGAPLAGVIGRVADDLLAQIDQRRSVAVAVAGARSSAALLAGLPVLGLLLGAAMQASPLTVLTGSPSGRLLFMVGVTLDAAGLLWTQQLAAGAERSS